VCQASWIQHQAWLFDAHDIAGSMLRTHRAAPDQVQVAGTVAGAKVVQPA
jgi:hypothetical protein